MSLLLKRRSIIPGFGLTLGLTFLYLSLIVLIPLSIIFIKTSTLSWDQFWYTISSPRALASYKLSLGASLIASFINIPFGFLIAWVLVRYSFPGKGIINSLIDLPFVLPTSIAGITLTTLYSNHGWIGNQLEILGIKSAFSPLGIIIALIFVGFPFIVRTVQPVLQDMNKEMEESAVSLGAGRWQIFKRIIFPIVFPSILTGFALSFARAMGEYGSVIFIYFN